MNNPKTEHTDNVIALVEPKTGSDIGAVFENRVDNAGVAAVIVQRQKQELLAKQEEAMKHLADVLKPAVRTASSAVLAAYGKALNTAMPVAKKLAESIFSGLAVPRYSDVSIELSVDGCAFHRAGADYVCTSAADTLVSLAVYATVTMTWNGSDFDGTHVLPFPSGDSCGAQDRAQSVTVLENNGPPVTRTSTVALVRYALPSYVVEAAVAHRAAVTAHDSVSAYVLDIRKVLQNTSELREQALAQLSEMSLRRTVGGAALLDSITGAVRTTFAPKLPPALEHRVKA